MAVEHSAEARGQLVAMLRRRMRLLIALVVAGTVAGVGAGVLLPAQYSATASVLVSPLEGNPYSPEGRGDDLINLETEAQLVQTDAVAELVQQKLKGEDVSTLRANVSTVVPPNTQILNIVYNASSGDGAEKGARAFAEAYLKYRQQRAQAVINGKLKKLEEQAAKVQENMTQANQQLATASSAQRTLLGQRITAYANQLGVIDEQKNDVSSTPVEPGQVINPAAAKGGAGVARIGIFGAAGLVAGALLGLALVLTRERLDRRLRTGEQVEAMGLRVLSIVPPGAGGELALADGARTPAGEAYRRLRSGIVANIQATPITMLVAGATPATTTSTTGTNLAVALAYAGSDTILVDATADEPDPAASFGLPPGKGLSEILLKGTDPAALLIHADSQLRLLPRGTNPAAASHRFSGPRMRDAVDTLRDRADFVLINAPDVHDADTQALCTLVDTVVLVVQDGVTTREDLQQAYAEVVHAGSTVLGVVIESSSGVPPRPVRHATAPRPAPAQQQPGGRAADRRRSGPPGEWGRTGDAGDGRAEGRGEGRGEGRARGESDTNTTVQLPALPAGPGKSGPPKSPPPKSPPLKGPQGGPGQAGPAQSGPPQGTPTASGLAKSPPPAGPPSSPPASPPSTPPSSPPASPPANGTAGRRRSDKPAERRPASGRGTGRHGTRGASQHFGSDRLAGRDTPDPQDKSVAGGADEGSPTNRTRDDFHL
ncbi:Wzz/FepE/Etk N-terminal domain-containing protein [Actinomadura rifamycini]|uniref:Wzz/FepE/Etk N-terminal domain-containing protein n=1 Tax=Actinomadura rifamycini TaxID=31962 RepID=UPI00041A5313|nr:Wzz/FepE/Etk N-terminal domain-containing protein [Actinomadura rifamycini]